LLVFTNKKEYFLFNISQIVEVFAAGTAAVVIPVGEINYKGESYKFLPENESIGKYTQKVLTTLTDIQYGRVQHRFQRKIV
jgi:branched-chain amino acid aminotransferase